MKHFLIFLLFIPFTFSCTQSQERDGGWVKGRTAKKEGSERSGRKNRKNQPAEERPVEGNSDGGVRNDGKNSSSSSGSQPAGHTSGNRSAPVFVPNRSMQVVPLPANALINFANTNVGDDFSIDFNAPTQLIPPGLIYGMNDLRNASPGCWNAWANAVTPTGGMLRMWMKYSNGPMDDGHFAMAQMAKEAGLDVMMTAVGYSREKPGGGRKQGGVSLSEIPDPKVWANDVIRDVKRLRERGFVVSHIEVWNEPNLGDPWPADIQSFANWFADVGVLLREGLGDTVQIGGPGLAGTMGEKLEWCQRMFRACKAKGFQPDFYSWHNYGSYPSEHDMLQVPQVILNEAVAAGLEPPQLILSEWNIGLPQPNFPGLDDQRAANYYMATVISLARTQVHDASFFFLQDAPWDTKRELAGESVGVFSLAGAPKAVLSGMRMMATAADLPAVPVVRGGSPSNISLFASRDGDQGYILAVNTFGGGLERHAVRLLRRAGVDIGSLKKGAKQIQAYVYGKGNEKSLRRLNLDAKTMEALDAVRAEVLAQDNEKNKGFRMVRIRLEGKPRSIKMVQLLDNQHGNPREDATFQAAYAPYSKGLSGPASAAALEQLRSEGVPQRTLDALQRGMKGGKGSISGVDRATTRRAQAVYAEALARLESEVPETLSLLSSTSAQEVDADSWCTLQGDILEIRLPLESSVLVELAW